MLTLSSQRSKKAFRSWLRYFVFVYQRAHSYEEQVHVPHSLQSLLDHLIAAVDEQDLKIMFFMGNEYLVEENLIFVLMGLSSKKY